MIQGDINDSMHELTTIERQGIQGTQKEIKHIRGQMSHLARHKSNNFEHVKFRLRSNVVNLWQIILSSHVYIQKILH